MSVSTRDRVTGTFIIPGTEIELDYRVDFYPDGMHEVDCEPCDHCDDEYIAWNDAHGAEINVEELIEAEARTELDKQIARERA